MSELTDAELVERAVRQAGAIGFEDPRWVHVKRVFAVGSTTATLLCRRFGLDPDEFIGCPDEEEHEEGE